MNTALYARGRVCTGALLNAALIRERRLELGLSERRLAALMGPSVSQTIIRSLEAGTNHGDLTLGDLNRLADLLSLNLADLLTTPEEQKASSAGDAAGPESLTDLLDCAVPKVSAVLFEIGRLTPLGAVSSTTGLTLDELAVVLDGLDTRLAPVGLGVHRLGHEVKIARRHDVGSRDMLEAAWREHLGRMGPIITQVRLLRRAARGQVPKTLGNADRVAAGQLVNAGILDRAPSGGVTLSADAAYSLLLPTEHSESVNLVNGLQEAS